MNTIEALKAENLLTASIRRDVVKQVIAAALSFDKKWGSVLDDHRLHFRYLPAIWQPIFVILVDLDWVKLAYAPEDDVDRITFVTMAYDCDGYDFKPTQLELCLGAILPRKLKIESIVITESGPESTDFNFDMNPVAEVTKLSLENAIKYDFMGLISDKIQKRNIFKWLMTLLEPEAIAVIALAYAFDDSKICCDALKKPRIAANKKSQQDALMKCRECRKIWKKFDFHPRDLLKLPENLLWDVLLHGLISLFETRNDAIPCFMNACIQNADGMVSNQGFLEIITGKGIHSVYTLDNDFYLVKSTTRAGITLAKTTCLMRLISKVKIMNGSVCIKPRTDFRSDAAEWLKMFVFKKNVRAVALWESAAESLALLIRHLSKTNMDYHPHVAEFQRQYYLDFSFNYCVDCTDCSCPVNEALDNFFNKMGKLLAMRPNRTACLTEILGYDGVEFFVKRNYDRCDKLRVWKSTDTSIFKETNGHEKSVLFGNESCKAVSSQLKTSSA